MLELILKLLEIAKTPLAALIHKLIPGFGVETQIGMRHGATIGEQAHIQLTLMINSQQAALVNKAICSIPALGASNIGRGGWEDMSMPGRGVNFPKAVSPHAPVSFRSEYAMAKADAQTHSRRQVEVKLELDIAGKRLIYRTHKVRFIEYS